MLTVEVKERSSFQIAPLESYRVESHCLDTYCWMSKDGLNKQHLICLTWANQTKESGWGLFTTEARQTLWPSSSSFKGSISTLSLVTSAKLMLSQSQICRSDENCAEVPHKQLRDNPSFSFTKDIHNSKRKKKTWIQRCSSDQSFWLFYLCSRFMMIFFILNASQMGFSYADRSVRAHRHQLSIL